MQASENSIEREQIRLGVDDSLGDGISVSFRGSPEQHITLVSEVVEERPLGQSRMSGDLGNCGAVESLGTKQLDRRLPKSF